MKSRLVSKVIFGTPSFSKTVTVTVTALGHKEAYFVKVHSDSKSVYPEDDNIKAIEFLVENIFVVFAGKFFQQIVGILMVTDCALRQADIFLYSHERVFAHNRKETVGISVQFNIHVHH